MFYPGSKPCHFLKYLEKQPCDTDHIVHIFQTTNLIPLTETMVTELTAALILDESIIKLICIMHTSLLKKTKVNSRIN